jgi:8-oxo-dGTP pyrophosphatase MutT (NUDIX family)
MARPVPPQVIPRPPTWRPGAAAPWALRPAAERTGISVTRVLAALSAYGQRGPAPDVIDATHFPEVAQPVTESSFPADSPITAAVLAALFEEAGEARVILTRRASSLRSHRGEVSFPGGRLDPGEDPPAAALREAYEEIALNPAQVTVEGWIHPVTTIVSASRIMPIVATLASRPHVVASPAEVERVFDVPLADLADLDNFHEEIWSFPGGTVPGRPDSSFPVWFFEVEGEMIWGATARMLHELLSVALVPAA